MANTPLNPCPSCGALADCCTTSKLRGDTADSLSGIVKRQSDEITRLTRELEEARRVIADLKANLNPHHPS